MRSFFRALPSLACLLAVACGSSTDDSAVSETSALERPVAYAVDLSRSEDGEKADWFVGYAEARPDGSLAMQPCHLQIPKISGVQATIAHEDLSAAAKMVWRRPGSAAQLEMKGLAIDVPLGTVWVNMTLRVKSDSLPLPTEGASAGDIVGAGQIELEAEFVRASKLVPDAPARSGMIEAAKKMSTAHELRLVPLDGGGCNAARAKLGVE